MPISHTCKKVNSTDTPPTLTHTYTSYYTHAAHTKYYILCANTYEGGNNGAHQHGTDEIGDGRPPLLGSEDITYDGLYGHNARTH